MNSLTNSRDWSFCLASSADGLLCAAALASRTNSTRGLFAVWESETGILVAQGTEGCTALAFTPDNVCLATGDDEGRVRVRALSGLTAVASFQQDRAPIHCIGFARDPSQVSDGSVKYPWLVATGDAGGTINIYQVALRKLKTICHGSQYDVYTIAFSPDGMTLASGGRESIHCWDVATGRSLLNIYYVGDDHHALGFSPDGSKLAFGTLEDSVGRAISGVIDLQPSRGVMALRGLSSQSSKVEFSHDGRRLAALSHNWEIGIWNVASNRLERLLEAPKGFSADNAALAFSRDDSQLAFATLTDARLWNLNTGRLLQSWSLPRGLVQHLCFDPAGRLLHFQREWPETEQPVVCKVRDLFRTNHMELAKLTNFSKRVFDAVLSREGDFLVVVGAGATGSNIVRVFDPTSGRQLRSLPNTGNTNNDWLAADPQTSRIGYSLGGSKGTAFYRIPSGELWRVVPTNVVWALAPDGRRLASHAPGKKGVLVLGADDPAWQLTVGIDHIAALWPRFSPNGRLLAWGTSEGTVLVCDLDETVRQLGELGLGWR